MNEGQQRQRAFKRLEMAAEGFHSAVSEDFKKATRIRVGGMVEMYIFAYLPYCENPMRAWNDIMQTLGIIP